MRYDELSDAEFIREWNDAVEKRIGVAALAKRLGCTRAAASGRAMRLRVVGHALWPMPRSPRIQMAQVQPTDTTLEEAGIDVADLRELVQRFRSQQASR